jgi:hypothetical protein
MNNCNNHGKCGSNGFCTCDAGYKGADCAEKVQVLIPSYNKQLLVNGTQWIFFQFSQGLYYGQTYNFTLSASQPLDIYLISGAESDPNEFNYDTAIKKQNYVQISFTQFPFLATFTAAVKVNGLDYYANKFNKVTLQAKFSVFDQQSSSAAAAAPTESSSKPNKLQASFTDMPEIDEQKVKDQASSLL